MLLVKSTSIEGSKNYLIFHTLFTTLELFNPDYVKVTFRKSVDISTKKIKSGNFNIAPEKKYSSQGKISLKFKKTVLMQEKLTFTYKKIVNIYLVNEFDNWPRICSNSFAIKNCFFGAVKLTRNAISKKFI